MKLSKFLFSLCLIVQCFCLPAPALQAQEPQSIEVATNQPSVEDSLLLQLNDLFVKVNNLSESGQEIPQDAKKLVQDISAKIQQAPTPTDRNTVEHWIALIEQLGTILLAAITGTFLLAESLGIVKSDIIQRIIPAAQAIKKRWLVVVSAGVMTILSLTVFKGEGGWSYVEAGAFLLPILFGAVRANIAAQNMGLKS